MGCLVSLMNSLPPWNLFHGAIRPQVRQRKKQVQIAAHGAHSRPLALTTHGNCNQDAFCGDLVVKVLQGMRLEGSSKKQAVNT